MHQLSINLLCSSDYRTTYSFCEIKHFVKQAKSLLIHFQGLLLKNVTCVITSFLVLRVLYTILFYRFDLSSLEEEIRAILWEWVFSGLVSTGLILADSMLMLKYFYCFCSER